MNKTIDCPVCGFSFSADVDSNNRCHCPNCESLLQLSSGMMEDYDFVTEFEDCSVESWKLQEEVKHLDDKSLEDEISEAVATLDFIKGTFSIFTDMSYMDTMTPISRKLAEGVYILIHTKNYFGYEQ